MTAYRAVMARLKTRFLTVADLDRDFQAGAPNRKWVADFTCAWTGEGWRFLADVIDLFSRRVVGELMQPSMTAQLLLDAFVMAPWRRGKPAEWLHHSGQGSLYTSEASSGWWRPNAFHAA